MFSTNNNSNNNRSVPYERLLDQDQDYRSNHVANQGSSNKRRSRLEFSYGLIVQIGLFLISLTILFISSTQKCDLVQQQQQQCKCDDFQPQWSPALRSVEGSGYMRRFDGSFATPNAFKGPPSPEIDASWDAITYATGGVIGISEETLRAVNASVDYSVKLAPEIGGGYMASVESLHQLHCLNILRQATYEDYYKDKAEPWQDSPETLRHHLDHCIDNLRQKLMCDADAEILTYVWVEGHPMPFPDFNVQHKCRNFDALVDWVEERQVYTNGNHGVVRLPGTKELSSPP